MNKLIFSLAILAMIGVSFAATSEAALTIQNSQSVPSILKSGTQDAVLQFDIYHAGTTSYSNITIDVQFSSPFSSSASSIFIPKRDPKSLSTVSVNFNVGEATTGIYTVPVKISYIDDNTGNPVSYYKYVYLQVSSRPELQISEIAQDNAFVGNKFSIYFTVDNSADIAASQATALVSMPSTSVITWVPISKNIDFIAAGSSERIRFDGIISEKAVPGSYSGVLTITYGTQILSNPFVIDVFGTPEILVSGVSKDSEPYVGKQISLSIQLENTGTGTAKSTKMTLKPTTKVTGVLDSYVGTVKADDTGSAVFDITLSETGINRIPLSVEYTDEIGAKHTIESYIEIYNSSAPVDNSGTILVVVVVVIVGFFAYRRLSAKPKKF